MPVRHRPTHASGIQCDAHRAYALSCEDYEALCTRSSGLCEACGYRPKRREGRLVIDHDHKYGDTAVRGSTRRLRPPGSCVPA